MADGSNVCCNSLSLPPCKHTRASYSLHYYFSSYFLHYSWAMWEGDSTPPSPLGFPPVQAAHCHLSFPNHSAQPWAPAAPQFLPSCAGAAGAKPFLPLSLSLGAVVAMLSSHTVCELKRQQWAAFSTAGHKLLLSGCVHVLIPLPQDLLLCRGSGEVLHVWVQPYAELQCGCHQRSTDGSKL